MRGLQQAQVPRYQMHEAGPEHLRRKGVLVMAFMDSIQNDPRRLQPHVHDFYQMYLLRSRTRVMLDFNEFAVEPDTLVFISPGQVHTVLMKPGQRLNGITISFTRDFFDDERVSASRLLDLPFFFPDQALPWRRLRKGAEKSDIVRECSQLLHEFRHGRPGSDEILQATLHILLVRARRLYETDACPPPSRPARLVREFQWLVEQHFQEARTLTTYARELGVTPNHLNDTVRAATGCAAGEFIRQRRLLHAKRLLLHSELSVAEIGYDMGFDDPSYFTRFFRQHEGMTPLAFREQIREKYQ